MENKKELIVIGSALVIICSVIIGMILIFKSSSKTNTQAAFSANSSSNLSQNSSMTPSITTQNMPTDKNQNNFKELIKEDTVIGSGKEAKPGDLITVNYTGKLVDGTVFDSSLNPGRTPFQFTLGAGEVIQGWDKGFDGMKEGGKRILKIPASMGYGSRGAGGVIKPNYDLVFEVELLKVNHL